MTVSALSVARIALGVALVLLGLVGVILGVADLIDPVGSKMADDADPLGAPHSALESALITGAYAVVLAAGCWITFLRRKAKGA